MKVSGSNNYKIEVTITSLIKMQDSPNFGHFDSIAILTQMQTQTMKKIHQNEIFVCFSLYKKIPISSEKKLMSGDLKRCVT